FSKGFQPPENTLELGPFRWTGPGTVSLGDFANVPSTAQTVRVRLLGSLSPEQLELRLSLNDALVPLTKKPMTPGFIFEGALPTELRGQSTFHAEFAVPKVLRPSNLNASSPDQRWLGIMFAWIEFLSAQPRSAANS